MERKPTSLAARFGWFALGHFLISITLCALFVCVLGPVAAVVIAPEWAAAALLAGMTTLALGAYFIAGAYTAHSRRWTAPAGGRERALAVLLPALAAWAWEGTAIAGMASDGSPGLQALAGFLLYAALFLAAPSVLFLFFCVGILNVGLWLDEPGFWVMAFLAGFLPPLLFALGSFWRAGRGPLPSEAPGEPPQEPDL